MMDNHPLHTLMSWRSNSKKSKRGHGQSAAWAGRGEGAPAPGEDHNLPSSCPFDLLDL